MLEARQRRHSSIAQLTQACFLLPLGAVHHEPIQPAPSQAALYTGEAYRHDTYGRGIAYTGSSPGTRGLYVSGDEEDTMHEAQSSSLSAGG